MSPYTQALGSPGALGDTMTYRIYLRHAGQRVSNKTTTDSESVALVAFNQLVSDYAGQNVAAVMTADGKQLRYEILDKLGGRNVNAR